MNTKNLTSPECLVHNSDDQTHLKPFKLAGVIVLGSVNSQQKCTQCKKKFVAKSFDSEGFLCANGCGTRPTRYYLVLKAFGIKDMFTDPRTNEVFKTHCHAFSTLNAINRDYLDAKRNRARFKVENWVPDEIAAKQIKTICAQRLEVLRKEVEKNKKSKTRLHNMTYALGFIVAFFGDRDIKQIDEVEIEKFYLTLIEKPLMSCRVEKNDNTTAPIKTLSSRYIKDIMDALRSLFFRYRPNDLPKFPVFDIEPAVQKQILGVQREMALMLHLPHRHGYRLAIEVLLQTGMHINEVRAPRRGDLVDGIIIVNKAIADDGRPKNKRKSGGEVFAKVTTDLWNRLQEHVQGKKSNDLIFTIDGEKPLGEGRLYKVLQKACADAGVEPISLQMASRHSTATRIKRKHDEEAYAEIEEVLGHENKNTGKEHYIVPPVYTKN